MSQWIAALPMYDWPETRAATDAEWAALCVALHNKGVDAPSKLVRRNADLPPVPGGIRDQAGMTIAPDPATLPPNEFDLHALWLHPALLFAQTCWGPMGLGLAAHVSVIGQPDYSAFEGGDGELYSSALVMRSDICDQAVVPPVSGGSLLSLDLLRGRRLAYNSVDSMSGMLAISRDIESLDETLGLFSSCIETGGHRASLRAVARGKADVAAIDCRSWSLFKHFEPTVSAGLRVVGWTARRKGLPFIAGRAVSQRDRLVLRETLHELGMTTDTDPID
ncbi:phosphate ABC transporter substrate-binding protein [Pseudaminobacter manganicus]|uniref:Phosphate ABC transporter substrate-binding protein n=2 Tax=Manganibacter manganicus TaxID=1873176 RepID=A0A1V8RWJ3_9HYPH|nr:PhnD/SsuA/transferrin family substrate-binding protein [Pseudaminobacter manganicus]OQM77494.1 phosphate ABC transporter substrate-binding protein [Pseudaminobacter manganicus]